MKLRYRMLTLPEMLALQPRDDLDNIAMVDSKGSLWFLWNRAFFDKYPTHLKNYKYTLKRLK